jgi:hypothetical protein
MTRWQLYYRDYSTQIKKGAFEPLLAQTVGQQCAISAFFSYGEIPLNNLEPLKASLIPIG